MSIARCEHHHRNYDTDFYPEQCPRCEAEGRCLNCGGLPDQQGCGICAADACGEPAIVLTEDQGRARPDGGAAPAPSLAPYPLRQYHTEATIEQGEAAIADWENRREEGRR